MEGMWTRFFPAVVKAQEIVKSGAIGKVVAVHADFGFNGADVASYPDHMFYNLNLGGGGLFYVAPYPVAAALQFLGPSRPTRIAAAGVKDALTGVDLSGAISLHFEGKGIASLTYNIEVRLIISLLVRAILTARSPHVVDGTFPVKRTLLDTSRATLTALAIILLIACFSHGAGNPLKSPTFPMFPLPLCAGRDSRRDYRRWHERPHQVAFPCPLPDGDRSDLKRKRTRFVSCSSRQPLLYMLWWPYMENVFSRCREYLSSKRMLPWWRANTFRHVAHGK